MEVNRGLIFWGVALITAGAVTLAVQAGAIPDETARQAWRWWPLVLIIIGLAIIAARTPFALVATLLAGLIVGGLAGTLVAGWPSGLSIGCGGAATERTAADGRFGASADIRLDLNCGELDVSTAAGSDWSVDARYASGAEPRISSSGDSLRVSADGPGVLGFGNGRQEWSVVLPTDPALDLDLRVNAASSSIDLSGASLARLRVGANAGDASIVLDGAEVSSFTLDANAGSVTISGDGETSLRGSVGMNAGSLELCLPASVAVALTLDDPNITFSHNLDDRGLTRQGDTWTSGSGPAAVTLEVDGNATSFTYSPDGGCR
jgi:hypothetical protein